MRVFAIDDEDSIKGIPNTKFEKLFNFDDSVSFPDFRNQKIKIAQYIIELENREPIRIAAEFYDYYEFDEKGRLDELRYNEKQLLDFNRVELLPDETKTNSNIIDGTKLFYEKRLEQEFRWHPDDKLKHQIYKKIFG